MDYSCYREKLNCSPRDTSAGGKNWFSDDYIKSNPAMPGGSLTSKPTWWNAFRCSVTSVFFALRWPCNHCKLLARTNNHECFRIGNGRAGCEGRNCLPNG